MAACQAQWLSMLMLELNLKGDEKMRLLLDSKSTIDLAKHLVAHGRSKNIETRFHYLRDQVTKEKLELENLQARGRLTNQTIEDWHV